MLKIHRPISTLQAGDLLTTFHPPLPLYIKNFYDFILKQFSLFKRQRTANFRIDGKLYTNKSTKRMVHPRKIRQKRVLCDEKFPYGKKYARCFDQSEPEFA